MWKKAVHIVFFTFLVTPFALSQNLIKNASFEAYNQCPKKLGNFDSDVLYWSSPTLGSTDYFNGCSKAMGTPKNFNGVQSANFGKGYAGLYLYAPDDYREYIQVELKEKLSKGTTYEVSFFVSLAERSDYAVKEFGVLFSENIVEIPIKKVLSKMQLYKDGDNSYNFMEIGYTNFYRDTKDWILVNTKFVAKGTEKFMTIGNFKSNARTRKFKTKRDAKQGAYYYIDMISLENETQLQNNKSEVVSDSPEKTEFELDKTHKFNNVLFSFDTYQLLVSAKKDLELIYKQMKSDTTLLITIHGHTDAVGTRQYNQALSENRCRAVAKYMKNLGLAKNRIKWQAHGGSKPIADNSTEKGRQLNRRVEFVFSKNGTY